MKQNKVTATNWVHSYVWIASRRVSYKRTALINQWHKCHRECDILVAVFINDADGHDVFNHW